MEAFFGHDFSRVRLHHGADAEASTREVNARAYTVGHHIAFGAQRYAPGTREGKRLLAHELSHVVQQEGNPTRATRVQRHIEMRDVGRGEQSGFARLPELVVRLNAVSQGLTFSLRGNELVYEIRAGGTLSNFDRQMMAFIDEGEVIPLRLTNRHGLLGNRIAGFHHQVIADAWTSGYVDIDDLLASTDVALQWMLVHFLRERAATRNYAHRIGTATFTQAEFNRVHGLGIRSEEAFLRDYFGDPTVRVVNDQPALPFVRIFRNSRRDLIRARRTPGRGAERGVDMISIDVRTRTGEILTPEEYRERLRQEGIREQETRERLAGAAEYHEGGRSIPAP
jgi:hypothetical protein